ncbi:hypothetical protein [Polyangium sorediatum]|uniref:Uncharacterized protein n=1 Tax=Polyangium sorediatum TaxID=889274 RepID=A0ABT6NZ55_9BACT|nr:hypothetical protein [Polyangium sorediatum]MDI1433635.1 hypothetical protein [Polyangium sorediatum]
MRHLRESDGSSVHRRHIHFHGTTCKDVSPLHDILHAEASAVYTKLRDAQRAREDAEDAATAASAGVLRTEVMVENAVREIDASAKKLDRKEPALAAQRTIFPAGISPVIKPDGQAQLDVLPAVRIRMAPFADKGDMGDALASLDYAEMLHDAALQAVNLAVGEVARRFAEEREARRAVREQLASAHGRLRDHYKAKPSAAEAFFLREKTAASLKTKQPSARAKQPKAPGSPT